MGNQKFTAEFREEAVRQVLDRGYSVKEVSENLGVSTHSLYKWLKDVRPRPEQRRDEELLECKREVLKLRAALRRTQVERDILKKRPRTSRATPSEVRVYRGASARPPHRDDVPGAGRGPQWVLRMGASTAVRASARKPTVARVDSRVLDCQRRYLWESARGERPPRGRRESG